MTTTRTTERPTKIIGSIWHYQTCWLVTLRKPDGFGGFSFIIDNDMCNTDQIRFHSALRDWFNSDCPENPMDVVREMGCFHNEGIFEITTKGHMENAMSKAFEIFEWATDVIGKWTLDRITNYGQTMPYQYITAEETDGIIKVYVCQDGVKGESMSSHQVREVIGDYINTIIYPSPAIALLETQVMWGGDAENRTKYLGSTGSREPWIKAWYWSNILKANTDNPNFGWTDKGVDCSSVNTTDNMPA